MPVSGLKPKAKLKKVYVDYAVNLQAGNGFVSTPAKFSWGFFFHRISTIFFKANWPTWRFIPYTRDSLAIYPFSLGIFFSNSASLRFYWTIWILIWKSLPKNFWRYILYQKVSEEKSLSKKVSEEKSLKKIYQKNLSRTTFSRDIPTKGRLMKNLSKKFRRE